MCAFRQQTGQPCLGCGGTEAFGEASRGHWTAAAAANPLGAFTGLAAWVPGRREPADPDRRGRGLAAADGSAHVLALLPLAFVVNAVVWWMSLPPGALR